MAMYTVTRPIEGQSEGVPQRLPAQLDEDGWGVAYFPTGILALRGTFKDEFLVRGQIYRENGILHFDGILQDNDLVSGKLYDESGCLQYEGKFQNGSPKGVGTFFNQDGSFCFGRFEDGELVDTEWKEEGQESHLYIFCLCPLSGHENSYVYIPCGHRILCGLCRDDLPERWTKSCPMCKREATLTKVIHA